MYRIRNWKKFQHYKDRCPPWIKLHWELLSSRDWVMLADDSRVLAIACMLIASRNGGEIPDDPEYVKRVAYLHKNPNFKPLVEVGFLELIADASGCKQMLADDTQEEETEEEREGEHTHTPDIGLISSRKHHDSSPNRSPNSSPILKLGEFGNVKMTEAERDKLMAVHGEALFKRGVEVLGDYIEGNGKRYKSHYAVLKADSWVWRKLAEQGVTAANAAPARPRRRCGT